jgi:hypothetical protein
MFHSRKKPKKHMTDRLQNKATRALWWVGWRPLVAGSLGGVVGVLAGYGNGSLGFPTAAFGVAVVAVGALQTWLRKIGFLGALAVFTVFYVAGVETVKNFLDSIGVGTDWTGFVADFVLNIASLVGVEPSGEPTAVVAGAVAGLALWSLAGAAGGVFPWLVGVYTVNNRYAGVYQDFTDRVKKEGKSLIGDRDSFYSFTHGEETLPLVRSAKRYHTTNVLVGDSSLSLHHGSTIDMVSGEEEMSNSTKELYYDQVASVDYEEPYLKVRMSDGQVVKIVTSQKPQELIEEIEKRLQRYKGSDRSAKNEVETDTRSSPSETDEKTEPQQGGERDGQEDVVGGVSEEGREIAEEVNEVLEEFDEAMGEDSNDEEDILGMFGTETAEKSQDGEGEDLSGDTDSKESSEGVDENEEG